MKVLRITVVDSEVGDDEGDFNRRVTERLNSAGFDMSGTIIRQERSDVRGIDFVQCRYTPIDTLLGKARHDYFVFKKWLSNQFKEQ